MNRKSFLFRKVKFSRSVKEKISGVENPLLPEDKKEAFIKLNPLSPQPGNCEKA
jgi:hypothetical protein